MLPRIGVFHGLLAGFLGMMYLTILYTLNRNYFLGGEWFGIWLIIVLFMLASASRQRKAMGGYIDFKLLLKPIFLTFIISMGMLLLYGDFMVGFFDIRLQEDIRQINLETHKQINIKMDSLEFKKLENEILHYNYGPRLVETFWLYMGYIIIGFIISAIIAASFSREKPEI
jgi:hypothetical protein